MTKQELQLVRIYKNLERSVVTPEVEAQLDAGMFPWEAVETYLFDTLYERFGVTYCQMDALLNEHCYKQDMAWLEAQSV